jgi:hypothetical protein
LRAPARATIIGAQEKIAEVRMLEKYSGRSAQ